MVCCHQPLRHVNSQQGHAAAFSMVCAQASANIRLAPPSMAKCNAQVGQPSPAARCWRIHSFSGRSTSLRCRFRVMAIPSHRSNTRPNRVANSGCGSRRHVSTGPPACRTACCACPADQSPFVAWRNQADRHAAVTLPPLLPVQISRFTSTGLKVQFPVRFSEAVYVPFFEDLSLRTSSHRYLLAAVIYHIGESRSHGHYRTALFLRGKPMHVTDDNCKPCPAHPADVHTAENNAYIFILCRDAACQEASAAR